MQRTEKRLRRCSRGFGPEYGSAGAAANGAEGFDLIKNEVPDLIIADISLPRLDGLMMLKKLRSKNIQSKVILLAEKEDFRQAKQALDIGVDGYFIKPVKMAELKKKIFQIEEHLDMEYVEESVFTVEKYNFGMPERTNGTG